MLFIIYPSYVFYFVERAVIGVFIYLFVFYLFIFKRSNEFVWNCEMENTGLRAWRERGDGGRRPLFKFITDNYKDQLYW